MAASTELIGSGEVEVVICSWWGLNRPNIAILPEFCMLAGGDLAVGDI